MAEAKAPYRRKKFAANSLIFDEGETANETYLILSGAVEIRKGVRKENPQVLGKLGAEDLFGEMALFDPEHQRNAAAVAIQDTEVLALSREEFKIFYQRMDPLMQKVMKTMLKRLREMNDRLVQQSNRWS
ncbi:MAG: Crp/Fnr family transcriptional regulator [Magnetospiraceae bacterium]